MPKDEGATTVQELAVLAAVPRRVEVHTFDEETDAPIVHKVRVPPMTLKVCGQVAAIIKETALKLPNKMTIDDLAVVVSDNLESVGKIVALCTNEPEEYIGSLPGDQIELLAKTVWEVNGAFFVRLFGLGKTLVKKDTGIGPTSSTTLPSTDTETP